MKSLTLQIMRDLRQRAEWHQALERYNATKYIVYQVENTVTVPKLAPVEELDFKERVILRVNARILIDWAKEHNVKLNFNQPAA